MSYDRLAIQRPIVEKASKSKMLKKYSGIMISGNNSNIIKGITGELRNVHNAVFKNRLGKEICEHCGAKERLDRAHIKSKIDIAKEILDKLHPKSDEQIDLNVFMTEFVLAHINVGIWMLCKKCHNKLG